MIFPGRCRPGLDRDQAAGSCGLDEQAKQEDRNAKEEINEHEKNNGF